jgi:hypothetical protein
MGFAVLWLKDAALGQGGGGVNRFHGPSSRPSGLAIPEPLRPKSGRWSATPSPEIVDLENLNEKRISSLSARSGGGRPPASSGLPGLEA